MRADTLIRLGLSLILPAVITATPAVAQSWFDYSGYVIDLPAYQHIRPELARFAGTREDQIVNLLRARIRPGLFLWTDATLSVEYEINALSASAAIPSTESTVLADRQVAELSWTILDTERHKVQHLIDRLSLRQNFRFGSIVIGRQRIAWGTGRIWNPTDLFNPINPALFGKIEKDGVDAVLLKWSIASFTDLSVVYNPADHFRKRNSAFRFRTNISEYDLSLVGGYFDERYIIGADFAGNLFDAGVRGEGIIRLKGDEDEEPFGQCILGIDYQWSPELYTLLEYQYNGEGESDPRLYRITRLYEGSILNLAQQYLACMAMYQIHPLLLLSAGFTVNMDDGSLFTNLTLQYSWLEDIQFSAGGMIFAGDSQDEYWYYPTVVLLRGEWYF